MKKNFTLFLFVITSFLFKTTGVYAQVNTNDSLALIDLYNSTNGAGWTNHTNWLTIAPVSTWFGVSVNGNRVSQLILSANNLSGNIPVEIGNLANLTYLNLSNNNLSGSIPDSLSSLHYLEYLILSNNNLSGNIPSQFGSNSLYNLYQLDLSHNQLSGNIPPGTGGPNIQYLHLEYNQLSGNIPSNLLSSLTQPGGLFLSHNKLSGSIPSTFGQLHTLHFLSLNSNRLTGKIPNSLNNLFELQSLKLNGNQLSGPVPNLDNLSSLHELSIENNQFTFAGMQRIATTFPFAVYTPQAKIPLHKNGNALSVSAGGTLNNNNYKWYKNGQLFTSKIGDSSLTVDNGTYYVAVSNSIATALTLQSDTVVVNFQFPPVNKNDSLVLVDIYNSTDGQHWTAGTNWLTEAPVHTWEGVTVLNDRVTELVLWGGLKNQLPSSIGNLSALTSLSVGDSYLTGSLPSSIGNLTELKGIFFEFNNYLNGALPSELGNLTNLTNLFFYSNALTGQIPSSLGNLKNLNSLTLSANKLSGRIPPELGNLSQLQTLNLSFNKLTGEIPIALSKLTHLQTLWLNRNHLRNKIPDLHNLTELQSFNLQLNNFTFAGLGQTVQTFPFTIYSPQANIKLNKNGNILSVYAGGGNALAHNTYKWYKGSTLVATITGDSTYQPTLSGNYSIAVTNSVATALTLYSDTVYVKTTVNKNDSLALVALYNNTNGAGWYHHENWLTSAPVSTWYGVTMSNNKVISIDISGNNLTGTIPPEIGNITNLTYLSLYANHLTGNVPIQLYNLSKLESLILSENELTGNIPAAISNLTILKYLLLDVNAFSGTIPSQIGKLDSLVSLVLNNNQFTGSIPPEITTLTNLENLVLSYNKFTGNIPAQIGKLSKLQYLLLYQNKLSGTLPYSLSTFQDNLYVIDISWNNFTYAGMKRLVNAYDTAHGHLEYTPQRKINISANANLLSVSVGGSINHETFKWYKDGSLVATISGDSTYTATESGTYSVVVTNSDLPYLILYSHEFKYTASAGLIVSGDNASKVNMFDAKVLLYPNPAKSFTTLSFNANGKYAITITNVSGKILQTKTGVANKGTNIIKLDVSRYTNGVYLITIIDEKNKKQTVKLNKE